MNNTKESSPRLGQRVRFTGTHPKVATGSGGMIDQLSPEGKFVVLTDCGGWFYWTSFEVWEPTGEPDVELNPKYVAMRTLALCDDSRIKRLRP